MAKTEGNTYEANWKQHGKGYTAWLKRRPRDKVKGATQEELVEQLWDIALDVFGDGEACIDLVPPLPAASSGGNYFDPAWFAFTCNEGFHPVGDSAALYREGACSFCHAGLGGRNDTERVVAGGLKANLGFVWNALPGATIVSEALLSYLRSTLGKKVRAIPCRTEGRSKKPMWELELNGDLPLVCHKKGTCNEGVVCPQCGTARFGAFVYEPIQKGYRMAVARSDLLELSRDVAVAWAGESRELIVSDTARRDIVERGLKGVLFNRLAHLPASEIGDFKLRKLKRSEV